LIACRMVDMTLVHGASPVSSVGFAAFGVLTSIDGKNTEEAFSYGNVALGLCDRFGEVAWVRRVTAAVFGCINIWIIPFRDCLEPMKHAYLLGLGSGDFQIAVLNASMYLWSSFESIPITEIYNFIQCLTDHMTFLGQEQYLLPLKPLLQMCRYFLGETSEKSRNIYDFIKDGSGVEDVHIEARDGQMGSINLYSMVVAYHFSNYELAERLCPKAAQHYRNFSSLGATVGRMYDALSNLAMVSRGNKRRIWQVRHHLKIMRVWSTNCPENFLGKQLLVEAELEWLLDNIPEAKAKYYMAIVQSRDAGILMQEALANELAGKFYLKIGDLLKAVPLFEEARRLYKAWGGIAKVRHLEQEIGYLFEN